MSTQPRSSTAPQDSSSAPDSTAELTAFLESIYPPAFFAPPPLSRPFVTLTYAQSLDGKIAGPGGAQIRLSGAESMVLTHRCVIAREGRWAQLMEVVAGCGSCTIQSWWGSGQS